MAIDPAGIDLRQRSPIRLPYVTPQQLPALRDQQAIGFGQGYTPRAITMPQLSPSPQVGFGGMPIVKNQAFQQTLSPLQQNGWGIQQINPQFLTGISQVAGGQIPQNVAFGNTPTNLKKTLAPLPPGPGGGGGSSAGGNGTDWQSLATMASLASKFSDYSGLTDYATGLFGGGEAAAAGGFSSAAGTGTGALGASTGIGAATGVGSTNTAAGLGAGYSSATPTVGSMFGTTAAEAGLGTGGAAAGSGATAGGSGAAAGGSGASAGTGAAAVAGPALYALAAAYITHNLTNGGSTNLSSLDGVPGVGYEDTSDGGKLTTLNGMGIRVGSDKDEHTGLFYFKNPATGQYDFMDPKDERALKQLAIAPQQLTNGALSIEVPKVSTGNPWGRGQQTKSGEEGFTANIMDIYNKYGGDSVFGSYQDWLSALSMLNSAAVSTD